MADENRVSMTEKKKVKEITDKLEAGLKELFENEKYKSYLSTMSKFHNYSANNIQLITMQCPEASYVAGYQAWRKKFNRHVKKDEHGISILAPVPYIIREERDKLDPVTGEVMLGKDGMPQTEEVERTIPAFRAVKVFDVSQTDGKPLPELETKELLFSVEGYEDFKQAVMNIAPVPVEFEDIPGDTKGYFIPEERRIAVQGDMAESQTLKTMIHETAHSVLHNAEVNKDNLVPIKDRNTKEVEAESIAFTVCQHFGIDTSDYSFGYIAGWSSGRDMKELKSSLDTIRRTASELITGIEGQLLEIQRYREMMQDMSIDEQDKESLLLIQNSDYSEYSLVSVSGMDAAQIVEALSNMNDDDRLSIAAYLESRGAWTVEIANQDTREFGEYHLDVRYNTDTNEITDLKAEMALNERAKEPIGADDVILKITHADGFEVERITNKTPEEVQEIMAALTKLEEKGIKSVHRCLEIYDADYIPIIVEGGRNSGMPQFNDYEIDLVKKDVVMKHHLSAIQQAEGIINRLEFAKTVFSDEERNLIVNYAYKLNDMEKTRELAEHIYHEEAEGNRGDALIAVIGAEEEIDSLPDPMIGLSQMHEYGYTWEKMLPLTKDVAKELFDNDLPVYLLHSDGSETSVESREQFDSYEGICGIEKADWENERNYQMMLEELAESAPEKEAQLLYGNTDKYGIYQLKDSRKLRDFHFAGTEELLKNNLLSDDFREIQPGNYNLIYTGELSDIQEQVQGEKLNAIFEKFNIDHPADYKGHSLSVSDIVVLHEDGKNSTHFVDSFGFTELPHFTRALEGVKVYPPLYSQTIDYAIENGEKEKFRESWELNNECKAAVEETIRNSFDGMHLKEDAVKPVLEEYGAERLHFILANTVKENEWDVRFSRDNVTWAMNFFTAGNMPYDAPGNVSLSVGSHPAVLNGFIDLFRREVLEQDKELSAGQEKVTSGQDLQKSEPEQTGQEQPESGQNEPEQPPETQEFEDMDDDDEIIDLGDEKEQVLAEMKKSLEGEQETELAFQIADRYISIQETEGGYDYSIMGEDYKEIDGGVYDNPDVSIREALNDIVEDLKENPHDNGARGNIRGNDELIPIDYNELIEKAEEAEHIVLENVQSSVVEDFRAKLDEVTLTVAECGEFHNLGEFHENIPTVDEAIAIWKQIPPERMYGIPAIGINIHTPGTKKIDDVGSDVLCGKHFDLEILEYIPEIKNSPQAMEVIAELMAKLPEMEKYGEMSQAMESKVWELRMPDLTPAEQLAVELDRFVYDYDTDLYRDSSRNMTENVSELAEAIEQRDTHNMMLWLADVITDGTEPEETKRATELLEKITEYKPLAKIEELEEANYNMVDNVLNNGAGEKAQREENKKEQESPAVKPSLKARLAEKKELVSGQGKDHESQEKLKNSQREM